MVNTLPCGLCLGKRCRPSSSRIHAVRPSSRGPPSACRRFEISPTTAYKWLARYATERPARASPITPADPHQMPQRTLHRARGWRSCGWRAPSRPTWGGRINWHARLKGPGLSHGAGPEHHHRDSPPRRLAPRRRGRPQVWACAALRAPHPQCLVANGFQRPFPRGLTAADPLTVLDDAPASPSASTPVPMNRARRCKPT